jgi:holo-[acyl-carrier protein] synthase
VSVRVGTDLVSVDTVRESIRVHAERYLERVYTQREVEDCSTPQGVDPERLAGRFAAKEATLKVLRPREQGLPWNTIEVRRDPSGWVELELSGQAASLASDAGIVGLTLSIAHEGGFATAVVVASCSSESRVTVR